MEGPGTGDAGVQVEQAAGLAAVSGIIARPVSSVITGGGLYVLGGAKSCPQVSGPLFSLVADGAPAGRERCGRARFRAAGAGGDGEERVREHRQRDVPVPGAVPADLVVVQAGLVLRLSEAVFHCPPGARDGDQLGQRHRPGRGAQEIRQLEVAFLARVQRSAGQQPPVRAGSLDERPVIQPRPLGPVGAAQPLPRRPRAPGPPAHPRAAGPPGRRSSHRRPPPARS